jgi:hypothetical protein
MIKYKLSIKCPNEECWNMNTEVTFWYVNPVANHPCGVCHHIIETVEVIGQAEFPDMPSILEATPEPPVEPYTEQQ